jgi:pseudaminic acid cytidylyltransferase
MKPITIAIIPARSGSKRIKNKNIKNFYNKPIIYYPIKAAKESKLFDKIIVSTDSKKIGSIAKKFGAEFSFIRPKYLSGDKIGIREVILDGINWAKKNFKKPSFICCIYPTAALLTSVDLKKSFKIIRTSKLNYIFSAVKNSYPIERAFSLTPYKKRVVMMNNKNFLKRSQDFKETYNDAGQFCWGTYEGWRKQRVIFARNSSIYLMSPLKAHDVDTYDDFEFLRKLYKLRNF